MTLNLDGFAQDYLVPGMALQAFFSQGESTAPGPTRSGLYAGAMLATGTATVNQPVRVKSEPQAKALFGAGSQLHRALRKHFQIHKNGAVWALPHADSAGTAADVDLTLATTATGAVLVEVTIAGELCAATGATGITPTAMGDLVVDLINARDHLPVTAANLAGVITITSKHASASASGTIPVHAKITSGAGMTITPASAYVGDDTAGADGGTTEAAALTTALAAVASSRYYYLGVTHADSASLAAMVSHIATKNTAGVGIRCVGHAATNRASTAANSLATGLNTALFSVGCQPQSEHTPEELCAFMLASRQRDETSAFLNCANMIGTTSPHIGGIRLASNRPDKDEVNTMLADGVTPIDGDGAIVAFVTTKSKTAGKNDQRAADIHRVSVVHSFMDAAFAKFAVTYSGFFLKPDKLLPDGSVDHSQNIPSKTLTPHLFRAFWNKLVNQYGDRLKDPETVKSAMSIAISDENASRLEVELNLDVVNLARQVGVAANEVSAG